VHVERLIVSSFAGERLVSTEAELDEAMRAHRGDGDQILISRENADYPALAVLVRDELAHVTYFPAPDTTGWAIRGNRPELDRTEKFTFLVPGDAYEVWCDQVVSFTDALTAARIFLREPSQRPKGLDWMDV